MSIEGSRPPTPDPALLLARAFASFGPAYVKWLRACFAAGGVSFPRMKLLGALHAGGPQIMSALGDELGVTARNVTALVDALEGEGLVRRVPHATDRRATVIELTPAGAKHGVEMSSGGHLDKVAELFRELSAAEQEQLSDLVAKLEGWLSARGYGGGGACGGQADAGV